MSFGIKVQLGLDTVGEQTTPAEKADKYNMIFKTFCWPLQHCLIT